MDAIADCTKAIKNMGIKDRLDKMKQLIQLTEKAVINNEAIYKSAKPAPNTNVEKRDGTTRALLRVHTIQPSWDNDRRMARNMAKDTPLVPRVSHTAVTRVEKPPKMAQDNLPLKNKW